MRIASALFVAAVLLSIAAPVQAAEFVSPDKDMGDVVLSTTHTYKNLYTAGGNVTVNSAVTGDAYIAGGSITLDGPVEADVVVAGGNITLNNKIGGDVRAAGGTISINSEVGGDVVVAGGRIVLGERAKVAGDVIVAGGTIAIDAPVAGKVWVGGGRVVINSTLGGELRVRGAEEVRFGSKAVVNGSVRVQAAQEPVVAEGARVSAIEFERNTGRADKGAVAKAAVFGGVLWVLAYVLVAVIASWVAPRRISRFVEDMKRGFWANVGIGLAGIVVTPIVAILLLFLLVGYQLTFVLLSGYVFFLALSLVLAVQFAGAYVYALAKKQNVLAITWQTALVGAAVFTLIRLVPVLGAAACALVFLAAAGQLLRSVKHAVVERPVAE